MKKTFFTVGSLAVAFTTVSYADEAQVESYTQNVVLPTTCVGLNKVAGMAYNVPAATAIQDFMGNALVSTTVSSWYGGTVSGEASNPELIIHNFSVNETTGLLDFGFNSRNPDFGATYGVLVLSANDIRAVAGGVEGATVDSVTMSFNLETVVTPIKSLTWSAWSYQNGTATKLGGEAGIASGAAVSIANVDVSGFGDGDALVLVLGMNTGKPAWNDAKVTGMGVSVTGTRPVPEPATATLSLLALAGLAARRRRK